MEAGFYWLIGVLIVVFILSIIAVGEAIKAIAKEGRARASAGNAITDIDHLRS